MPYFKMEVRDGETWKCDECESEIEEGQAILDFNLETHTILGVYHVACKTPEGPRRPPEDRETIEV